ncbi:hypothetical protein Tco_0698570 [Tanacetum coccineum]
MPSIRCVNPSIRAYIHRIRLVGHDISSWIQASYLSVLEQLNTAYSHDVDTPYPSFSAEYILLGIMKSGFLTPGGRGVKEKEGLNAGKTISGGESSCNTLSDTHVDLDTNVGLSAPTSYTKLVTGEPSRKSMNFRTLIAPAGNGADVAISLESIRDIRERYANMVYGFFFGNMWLTQLLITMSRTLIVNMDLSNLVEFGCKLIKEDIGNVSVWVKFHGVPMKAFSKDRLSVIAIKLGTPLMRDSYTTDMYMHSWGKSSYARAMIELRANVEYEWKPPKCSSCKVFGHILNEFPKKIISDVAKNLKNPRQATRGVPVGSKQVVVCRQEVSKSNPFDALNLIKNDDDLDTNGGISKSDEKGSLNVAHGSSSNTIIDKIEKLECQIVTTINFQKFK